MANLCRLTALLALTLAMAGCGGAPEKPQAEAKADGEKIAAPKKPVAEAKPPVTAQPEAKAAAPAKEPSADAGLEAEISKALAKLSPEDRKIAEAQRFCVVEEENRLGSMETPIKLTIKGQTVFVCCGGCKKQALAEADKTLAKAEELKKKSAAHTK